MFFSPVWQELSGKVLRRGHKLVECRELAPPVPSNVSNTS